MAVTTAKDLFALWAWPFEAMRLGTDLAETMIGAQSVISTRLPIMGTALTDPLHADHRELGRMVTENVSAFRTSGKSVERAAGRPGYLLWAAAQLAKFRAFSLTITNDGEEVTIDAVEVRIANGPIMVESSLLKLHGSTAEISSSKSFPANAGVTYC